jgi:hypothetical protein
MLAAITNEDARMLELFRLALKLIANGEKPSDELQSYFENVWTQARILIDNPCNSTGRVLPEAIQLATDMSSLSELRALIETIDRPDQISSVEAGKVASNLEHSFCAH